MSNETWEKTIYDAIEDEEHTMLVSFSVNDFGVVQVTREVFASMLLELGWRQRHWAEDE